MVLSVFSGNKDCPTRDVLGGEGKESYVFPAWKQSWAAVGKCRETSAPTYGPPLVSPVSGSIVFEEHFTKTKLGKPRGWPCDDKTSFDRLRRHAG